MADAISPQALSGLIGSIYDCALDPSRWERTLADVMEALDCHGIALILTDLRYDLLLLHKTVGIEPDQVERVLKYIPDLHAAISEALTSLPCLDEPHVESRHLSAAFYRNVRLYSGMGKTERHNRQHALILDAHAKV
jgi:hypothetical protein